MVGEVENSMQKKKDFSSPVIFLSIIVRFFFCPIVIDSVREGKKLKGENEREREKNNNLPQSWHAMTISHTKKVMEKKVCTWYSRTPIYVYKVR